MNEFLLFLRTKLYTTARLLGVLLILLVTAGVTKGQEPVPCPTDCGTSADTWIESVFLADINGVPLAADFDCETDPLPPGGVYLYGNLGGSTNANNRHSLRVFFNVYIDDTFDHFVDVCLFSGTGQNIPPPSGGLVPIQITPVSWNCGEEIRLENFFINWATGGSPDGTCGCTNKCWYSGTPIIVQAPLVARFDWEPDCSGEGAVSQIKAWPTTSGGTGTYSHSWDVSDASGSITSTDGDTIWVTYVSGSAGDINSIELTANDGIYIKSVSEDVTLGTCCILTITNASNGSSECQGTVPGNNTNFTAWLSNNGGAVDTESCGNVTWSNNAGTQSWSSGTCSESITVTFTAEDEDGNTASTTATYTINDTTAPAFACPTNFNVVTDAGKNFATVTIPVPTVTEVCGSYTLTNDFNGTANASDEYPVGTTTVIYTATDACGLTSTCSFTVTVADNEDPSITCAVGSPFSRDTDPGQNDYTVDGTEFDPTFSDNVAGSFVTNDYNGLESLDGAVFQLGQTTIVWTAEDAAGNTATCSIVVNVSDNEDPEIYCAQGSPFSRDTDLGEDDYTAVGSEFDPAFSDNVAGSFVTNDFNGLATLDGAVLPLGGTTIVWTVEDAAGNTATCSITVNVSDNEDPSITCAMGSPFSRDTDAGENTYTVSGSEFDPSFSDNVAGSFVTNDFNGLATLDGAVFPLGSTTIVWTVEDAAGNTATCSIVVNVSDNEDPSITCAVGSPFSRDTDLGEDDYTAVGNEFDPAFSDNVAGSFVTNDYNGLATLDGAVFPLGSTTIVWTVEDAAGNTATCSIVVNVSDNEDPSITCAVGSPFSRDTDPGQNDYTVDGSEFDPTFSDNVAGSFVTNDFNGLATLDGAVFPLGSTTIVWTVEDAAGNTATCSIVVNVSDNEDPSITCAMGSPFSRDTDAGENTYTVSGSEFDPSFSDNVAGSFVTNDFNGLATLDGVVLPLGGTTIVWTAEDAAGNTATCTIVVNVGDNEDPEIYCAQGSPFSRDTDLGEDNYTAVGSEFDPAFSDNVAGAFVTNDYNGLATLDGAVFPLGSTTIVWTVEDAAGNTATCSIVVNVSDNEDPSITCAMGSPFSRDTDLGENTYTVSGSEFDPSFSDNVAGSFVTNDFNGLATLDGAVLPLGGTTIVWTVEDAAGNTATCSIVVNVSDNEDPSITCAMGSPFSRDTDLGEDNYTAVGSEFDPSFSDNVAGSFVTNDFNGLATLDGAVLPLGGTTIVWTVEDAAGNTATCSIVVNVSDNEDPEIYCVQGSPFSRDTDLGENTYTVSGIEFDPSFSDNVAGSFVTNDFNGLATLDGAVLPLGGTTIVWTVEDAAGNTATCSIVVNVSDNEDPSITCAMGSPFSRDTDAGENTYTVSGSEFDPSFSDNVAGSFVTNDFNGLATLDGAVLPLGGTTIVWTVEDAAGNTATCSIVVNVSDNEDPSITCAMGSPFSRDTDLGEDNYTAVGSEFDPSFSDNVAGSFVTNDFNGLATLDGAVFPLGSTTIVWTVEDAAGNTATCSIVVNVSDNEDPSITCAVGSPFSRDTDPGQNDYTVDGSEFDPTFSDNVAGSFVTNDYNGLATLDGVLFPLGSTTIVWTVEDAAGNTATCSIVVNVGDNEDPEIYCAQGSPFSRDTDLGEDNYTAVGSEFDPAFSDNVAGAFVTNDYNGLATLDGAVFPLGSTTIVWTVEDAAGNTATCSIMVNVSDNEDPSITCATPLSSYSNDEGECSFTVKDGSLDPMVSDNDAINSVMNDYNGSFTLQGAEFPLGTTIVTWTVEDESGNTSTCQITINVEDNTNPTIVTCAPAQTIDAGAECTALVPDFTAGVVAGDNCDGSVQANLTVTQSPAAGTSVGIGSHTIFITVTDEAGNSAFCSTTLTVEDNTNPTIVTCAPAQTIDAGAECTALVPDFTAGVVAGDNCDGSVQANLTVTQSPAAGTSVGIGSHTITITVTDEAGNSAVCSTTLTVEDNTNPTITTCAPAQTISADALCSAVVPDFTADVVAGDNCDGSVQANLTVTQSPAAGTSVGIGSHTITITVTDEAGNSAVCSTTLTVIDDTDPVITPASDLTIECADLGNLELVAEWLASVQVTDNCDSNVEITVNIDLETLDLSCDNIGETTVVWTATDDGDNTSQTTAVLIINDNRVPNFGEVVDLTVECDGMGNTEDFDMFLSQFVIDDPEVTMNLVQTVTEGCGLTKSILVTGTATYGNEIEVSASATFHIIDTTPPVVTAPEDITIEADENCEWNDLPEITGMATVSDLCSEEGSMDESIGYSDVVVDLGQGMYQITRTWTASDECGNSGSDQQVITVTGGNAPPVLVLNEVDIYLTEEGQWTLNQHNINAITAGSQAGCGSGDDLTYVFSQRYFDCNDVFEPVEVVVTASDSKGNSAFGSIFINVHDTIAPVALCEDLTVYLDSNGQVMIVPGNINMDSDRESVPAWARHHNNLEGGSYDACGIAAMDLSQMIFTCNDLGENVVTLTVYDPSGNFATCQATVTVLDTITPVFAAVENVVLTVEPGVCETTIDYPQIVANDNCPVVPQLMAGHGPDGVFPLGTTTEVWKAVDASGNEAMMSFTVTVNTYNAAPTIAAIEDIVVDEDPILIEIPLTNITPNMDCDLQQVISVEASTDNNTLITDLELEYTQGETTGTLLVTVEPNLNGQATVSITVKDNGGTENGGSDTTVETFTITVVPVPDMPEVVIPGGTVAIEPGQPVHIDLNDLFTNPDDEDGLTFEVTLPDGSPLPEWVEFDPETGIISGTPGEGDSGVIEVTIIATNPAGDSVETTVTVIIIEEETSVINGTVLTPDGPASAGIAVALFSVGENNLHTLVSQVNVAANGSFTFYNVANGTYLIKAIVTDEDLHPTLFHTWYETALSVLDATAIVISQPGAENIQVTMVDGRQQDGSFTAGGTIIVKVNEDDPGTPAAMVEVVLKQDGIIVATTMTDEDGNFSFEGLPEGSYDVFVEIPGYDQEITATIVVNQENPVVGDIDFTIWTTDDRIITDVDIVDGSFDLKMYPNPTQGMVNIELIDMNFSKVQVTVYNVLGARVFSREYPAGDRIQFNMNGNVSGMYLVKIDTEGRSAVKKLMLDLK